MDFRFTPDELEVHRYARTSARRHLPLTRLSDPQAEIAGWAAFAADGWTEACLGEVGPDDLPFLSGIAREAGAMAAGEGFVHTGWLLPRLCARADEPGRSEWLAALCERPGLLHDERRAGDVRVVRPGFADYRFEDGVLLRSAGTDDAVDALGGLSVQLGRARSEVDPGLKLRVPISAAEVAQLRTGATVLRAAGLVGLAAEILAVTVAYVGEREQFGQVIGKFQALKHICADVHAQVEVAWLAVLHAGVVPDDPIAVDGATHLATNIALEAARAGAQLHGGMGFTWESDLHWLLKAALDGQVTAGPAGAAAQRIGAAVVGCG